MLDDQIKDKIRLLLDPEEMKVHGRPIYAQDLENCGLNIEIKDVKEKFWSLIYKLYIRLNNYVSTNNIAKCIESKDYSFIAKSRTEE